MSESLENVTFFPRNDFVIVRIEVQDKLRKLALPQQSADAKRYFVEAIGPKVEDLKVGDEVRMTGQPNVDWANLPGRNDLLIIREGNVLVKITRKLVEA